MDDEPDDRAWNDVISSLAPQIVQVCNFGNDDEHRVTLDDMTAVFAQYGTV